MAKRKRLSKIEKEQRRINRIIAKYEKEYGASVDERIVQIASGEMYKSHTAKLKHMVELNSDIIAQHARILEGENAGRTVAEVRSTNRSESAKKGFRTRLRNQIADELHRMDTESGTDMFDSFDSMEDLDELVNMLYEQTGSTKEVKRIVSERFSVYIDWANDDLPHETDVVINNVASELSNALGEEWSYETFREGLIDRYQQVIDSAMMTGKRVTMKQNAAMVNNLIADAIKKTGSTEAVATMLQEGAANGVILSYEVFYDDAQAIEFVNRLLDYLPASDDVKNDIKNGLSSFGYVDRS